MAHTLHVVTMARHKHAPARTRATMRTTSPAYRPQPCNASSLGRNATPLGTRPLDTARNVFVRHLPDVNVLAENRPSRTAATPSVLTSSSLPRRCKARA